MPTHRYLGNVDLNAITELGYAFTIGMLTK